MNTINLIGRLTSDPELKNTSGTDPAAVCRFTVAVRRNADITDFIDCVAFQGTAELVEKYFRKGHLIGVAGSLHIDRYEDKDGNKRRSATVQARSVYFCDSGSRTPIDEDMNEELEEPAKKPAAKQKSYGRNKARY